MKESLAAQVVTSCSITEPAYQTKVVVIISYPSKFKNKSDQVNYAIDRMLRGLSP